MPLKNVSRAVLTGILTRVRPELLPILEAKEPDRSEVLEILDVIGNELAAFGFDASSTPTAYGMLLERIIDEVNRIGFEWVGARG